MVLDKYSIDGKVVGKVEVNDGVFRADVNDNLIYELIRVANSNLRQGTHSTKRHLQRRTRDLYPKQNQLNS